MGKLVGAALVLMALPGAAFAAGIPALVCQAPISSTTLPNFPARVLSTVVTSTTAAALNSPVIDDLVRVGLNDHFVAGPVVT